MTSFARDEARNWARAHLHGVANVILPSFDESFTKLNEAAIRFDVARDIELGFGGALVVGEAGTTLEEYALMTEACVQEATEDFMVMFHACFNSLEENVAMAQAAERAGVEVALLAYPPNFFPRNDDDIFAYTQAFCTGTDMAVILFPLPYWGFERIHPASISPRLLVRIVAELPTIVCIKAEGGMPSIAGFTEAHRLVGREVMVQFPVEDQALPLATLVDMPFIGTNNTHYYGDRIPRIHALIREGQINEAMEMFWALAPARAANRAMVAGPAHAIHRQVWKYQAWLNGFNGGGLRQPTMRLVGNQMATLRNALQASGITPTEDPDELFFVGRVPS